MKNILIIGGTGFIGSHLVERLWHDKYNVTVLIRKNSDTKFIEKFSEVKFCRGDLLDFYSLQKALKGIDTVFCLVNIKPFEKTEEEYERQLYLLHSTGTMNLIKAIKQSKTKRLIYLSSVAAMGYKKRITVYDEFISFNPIDSYGKAKLEAEKILNTSKGINITILRPVGVFGERGLGVLNKIIKFIEKGVVFVVGNGKNRQSIVYVGNLINQIMLVAKDRRSSGKTYIVSDKSACTVNELVTSVSQALEKHPLVIHVSVSLIMALATLLNCLGRIFTGKEIVNKESIIAIATERIFDGSKFFKELNYKEEYDLSSSVARTVKWYKE